MLTRFGRSFGLLAPLFVVALVMAIFHDWRLVGDSALEVIRARDVFGNLPLLGTYSRYGWAHPGPALFALFALPARWFGNPSGAVVVVALVFKWACLSFGTAVVWRRAGRGAALAASAAGALLVVNLYEGIWAVWNPTMAVPVLFTTVLLCSFADDWEWTLPLAVFGMTLMVQFHIGYAGAVAVLVAVLAWRVRPTRRAVGVTAGVVGITWLLPVVDQVAGTGNLRDLATFALNNDEETVGLSRSLGIVARQLSPIGPWIGGSEPTGFLGGVTPISPVWLVVPAAALAMLARFSRTADPATRTFVVTLAALSIASVIMVSRITEAPFPYLVMWIRAIAALLWGAVAYVALISRSRLNVPGMIAAIGALAVASLIVVTDRIDTFESRATRALEQTALDAIPVGTRVELVFTEFFPGAGEGIALTLESRGRNTSISAAPEDRIRLGRMWGEHRIVGQEQLTTLAFARDDDIDDLVAQGWTLLADHREDGVRQGLLLLEFAGPE